MAKRKMVAFVAENLKELNELLQHVSEPDSVEIQFTSSVVGTKKDPNGIEKFEVVDRFLVIHKA